MQDKEDLFGMFKLAFTFRKQKSPTLHDQMLLKKLVTCLNVER